MLYTSQLEGKIKAEATCTKLCLSDSIVVYLRIGGMVIFILIYNILVLCRPCVSFDTNTDTAPNDFSSISKGCLVTAVSVAIGNDERTGRHDMEEGLDFKFAYWVDGDGGTYSKTYVNRMKSNGRVVVFVFIAFIVKEVGIIYASVFFFEFGITDIKACINAELYHVGNRLLMHIDYSTDREGKSHLTIILFIEVNIVEFSPFVA